MATPGQYIFGIEMIFNLTSFVDWRFVTTAKQRQVDIDNDQENARWVTHDYAIGDQVYVELTRIYGKLDYRKQRAYRITEVFTNCTVWLQQGQVN